jgi:aldehyde:ferredoxin oxidoreductase
MSTTDIQAIKQAHRVLAEFTYQPTTLEQGYAGRTLCVNLSDNTIASKPVTQQMKDIFIGGRGFGLKLLWDAVTPDTRWNDAENAIVISSGPLGGTTGYPGSGKSLVVSLSPLTNSVMDSNVGGYYGRFSNSPAGTPLRFRARPKRTSLSL